jgi:hypothetical protein
LEQSLSGVEMVAGSNFLPLRRIWMDLGHFLDDSDCSCGENLSFILIGREGDRMHFVRGQRGGQRAVMVLKWWPVQNFGLLGGFGWISATSWTIWIVLAVKPHLLYQSGGRETRHAL